MGSLLLIVMLIFIILFAISVPTVIADLKAQRQKDLPNGSLRERKEL
jgi:type II secretory pathway pseudopilin PulG